MTEWHDHLTGVARKLLRAWALALGAEEQYFDRHFGDPQTLIKIVRYPGKDDPTPQQGVGAHKDSGVLTLLWVEPGKGGLQVERDGEWVDAPPVSGAFVVNIGELLEYATQGYLRATNHRVISPRFPDERISVPFFFNPALDARLPIIELPAELAAEARGVEDDPTNPIHATYGENALKSRLRAHPDVAERWHPDLVAARAHSDRRPRGILIPPARHPGPARAASRLRRETRSARRNNATCVSFRRSRLSRGAGAPPAVSGAPAPSHGAGAPPTVSGARPPRHTRRCASGCVPRAGCHGAGAPPAACRAPVVTRRRCASGCVPRAGCITRCRCTPQRAARARRVAHPE